jgi:hypothetical protein
MPNATQMKAIFTGFSETENILNFIKEVKYHNLLLRFLRR